MNQSHKKQYNYYTAEFDYFDLNDIVICPKINCKGIVRFIGNMHQNSNDVYYGLELNQDKGCGDGTPYFKTEINYAIYVTSDEIKQDPINAKATQQDMLLDCEPPLKRRKTTKGSVSTKKTLQSALKRKAPQKKVVEIEKVDDNQISNQRCSVCSSPKPRNNNIKQDKKEMPDLDVKLNNNNNSNSNNNSNDNNTISKLINGLKIVRINANKNTNDNTDIKTENNAFDSMDNIIGQLENLQFDADANNAMAENTKMNNIIHKLGNLDVNNSNKNDIQTMVHDINKEINSFIIWRNVDLQILLLYKIKLQITSVFEIKTHADGAQQNKKEQATIMEIVDRLKAMKRLSPSHFREFANQNQWCHHILSAYDDAIICESPWDAFT